MARRTGTRLFAGHELRALRQRVGLGQAAMAARVGLSVSYLSQLENDDRPLTPAVGEAGAKAFPIDWNRDTAGDAERRLATLREAFADPLFATAEVGPQMLHRMVEQQPVFADQFVRLHDAWRRAEERLQLVDDRIASGVPGDDRLPWEEVRDWFHEEGNYVDVIDRAAEARAVRALYRRAGKSEIARTVRRAAQFQRCFERRRRRRRGSAACCWAGPPPSACWCSSTG